MYDIDSFLSHNTGWKPADPCNFCIVEPKGLKQKPSPEEKPESLQTSLTLSQFL